MSQAEIVSAMNARQQLGRLLGDVKFKGGEYVKRTVSLPP